MPGTTDNTEQGGNRFIGHAPRNVREVAQP